MRTATVCMISKDVRFALGRSNDMPKDPLVFLAVLSGSEAGLEHLSRHSDSHGSRVNTLNPFFRSPTVPECARARKWQREVKHPATITVSSLPRLRTSSLLPSIRQPDRRLNSPHAARPAKGHLTQQHFRGKKEPFPPDYVCTQSSGSTSRLYLKSFSLFGLHSGVVVWLLLEPEDEEAEVNLSACWFDLVGPNRTNRSDTRWTDTRWKAMNILVLSHSMESVFIRQSHPSMQSRHAKSQHCGKVSFLGSPMCRKTNCA